MADPAYSTSASAVSTRRQFIGALAFSPALALPAVAAVPDRSEWDALVAAHDKARAAFDTADLRLTRADSEWEAKCLPYPELTYEGAPIAPRALRSLHKLHAELGTERSGNWKTRPEVVELRRGLAELRRVDLANARLKRAMGIPGLQETVHRAFDEERRLFGQITGYPATSLALLAAKIDYLEEDGGAADFGEEIIADVRRIAAQAAH